MSTWGVVARLHLVCFFVAKDTAVNLQRKCGQNANKSIRGAFAKVG